MTDDDRPERSGTAPVPAAATLAASAPADAAPELLPAEVGE